MTAVYSSDPFESTDWLRDYSDGSNPSFRGPVDANSSVIAVGWIEQSRRSKMQMVWKAVVVSLVKGRRPGEQTTFWIQRQSGNRLETLQKIPIKWIRGVSCAGYMGAKEFSLTCYNLEDGDFTFRCRDAEATQKWVTTLQTVQQFVKGGSSSAAFTVKPRAPEPEKDLINFDDVSPAQQPQASQRLSAADFAFVQQQHALHQQQHPPQHQWVNNGMHSQQHQHFHPQQAPWQGQPPSQFSHHPMRRATAPPQYHHGPHVPHRAPLHNQQPQWNNHHQQPINMRASYPSSAPQWQGMAPQQPPRTPTPPPTHHHSQAPRSHPGFATTASPPTATHGPSPPNSAGTPSTGTPSKYATTTPPSSGETTTTGTLKRQILTQWALSPPQMQQLRPLDRLLTSAHTCFAWVPAHDYFAKRPTVSHAALCTHHVVDADLVAKALKKWRVFLHPDKLPRDLNTEQQFLCKLLWDVLNDAAETKK